MQLDSKMILIILLYILIVIMIIGSIYEYNKIHKRIAELEKKIELGLEERRVFPKII